MAQEREGKATRKPPVLFGRTQEVLARVEELTGGKVLCYWCSPTGSVGASDVIALYQLLRKLGPTEHVHLFIKSDGGAGTVALRMTNVLRQFAKQVTALVALECASAATMMALGADKIQMGPLGFLTAVDTSIRHELSPSDIDNELVSVSQDELTRAIRLWKSELSEGDTNPYQAVFQHVHPLVVGAVDRASSLSIKLCQDILSYHMADRDAAAAISQRLNSDYPSHSYPIHLEEARRIGLEATGMDPEVNDALLALHEIYSEMGQKADTDYDEYNYHTNAIRKIFEARDMMLYYQTDKDWHYRKEERRWSSLNDRSSWRRVENVDGKEVTSVFHTR
jgi:hypothetical protein